MVERGMGSHVSGESEVELKCLSVPVGQKKGRPKFSKPEDLRGQKTLSPHGVPGLSFYRPREGQAYMKERKEKKKEKKKLSEPILSAVPPSSLVGLMWYHRR
jgi:hypothetical protein